MRKEKKQRILYFIQLPPPVHGVSVINKIIFNSNKINDGFEKKLIQICFSKDIRNIRRYTPEKLFSLIKLSFKLIQAIIIFKPDFIYFSFMPVGVGFFRDSFFAFLMKINRKPIIFHLHNRGIHKLIKNPIYRLLYNFTLRNSTLIHLSKKLLDEEILLNDFNNVKTYVVPNTIPENLVRTESEMGKREKIHILFLSNYLPQKGLMELLEAILLLIKSNPIDGIELHTYGAIYNTSYFNRCKLFVENHQLSDIITIHGPLYGNRKREIFAYADIFIFPSYFEEECFPLSILEAMNAKLPIIATKIGAIPEMLEDNRDGLLVDPNNPIQISEKLKSLIENAELRTKLGNNAFIKFTGYYSMPIFENNMKNIFESVIHDARH